MIVLLQYNKVKTPPDPERTCPVPQTLVPSVEPPCHLDPTVSHPASLAAGRQRVEQRPRDQGHCGGDNLLVMLPVRTILVSIPGTLHCCKLFPSSVHTHTHTLKCMNTFSRKIEGTDQARV